MILLTVEQIKTIIEIDCNASLVIDLVLISAFSCSKPCNFCDVALFNMQEYYASVYHTNRFDWLCTLIYSVFSFFMLHSVQAEIILTFAFVRPPSTILFPILLFYLLTSFGDNVSYCFE
jgi:hypothetical protein